MPRYLIALALALVLSWHVACGGKSPTSPTAPAVSANPLTGTWSGTAQETVIPGITSAVIRTTISQSGASLSGQWSTTYANPVYNNSGSFSGTVTGASVSILLQPSVPASCPSRVTATYSGRVMTGTYAAFNCTVPSGGTVSLTQQ